MRELFVFCEKGDNLVNEDVFGISGQFAWVIDGATDVFHRNAIFPDAEVSRYVNILNQRITQYAPDYRPNQIHQLLMDAITSVYDDLNCNAALDDIPEYELPTFAVAMAGVERNILHYVILGDCFLSYLSTGGFPIITDIRISDFSKHNRERLKEYYSDPDHSPDPQTIFQSTRKKANTIDGYPIGSVRGSGIPNALTGEIPMADNSRLILCSDGFLDYYRSNAENNVNFFKIETIREEIENMKQYLSDDFRFSNDPRPKKIDDSTIMLMEV